MTVIKNGSYPFDKRNKEHSDFFLSFFFLSSGPCRYAHRRLMLTRRSWDAYDRPSRMNVGLRHVIRRHCFVYTRLERSTSLIDKQKVETHLLTQDSQQQPHSSLKKEKKKKKRKKKSIYSRRISVFTFHLTTDGMTLQFRTISTVCRLNGFQISMSSVLQWSLGGAASLINLHTANSKVNIVTCDVFRFCDFWRL